MLKVQIIIDFVGACFVRDASEAKANRPSFIVKFFCKRVLAITSKRSVAAQQCDAARGQNNLLESFGDLGKLLHEDLICRI